MGLEVMLARGCGADVKHVEVAAPRDGLWLCTVGMLYSLRM